MFVITPVMQVYEWWDTWW